MKWSLIKQMALGACLLMTAPAPGFAQPQVAEVSVLPGWRISDRAHMAAIAISLAPGWKTYWRAPGDAGIPPTVDWSASENVAAVKLYWPAPEVFHVSGIRSIGYRGELLLPVEVEPRDPLAPILLEADLEFGVCEDICIPMQAKLVVELPPQGREDRRISAALASVPRSAASAGVGKVVCSVEPIDDGLRVTARIPMGRAPGSDVVVEAGDPSIWVSEPMTYRAGDLLSAEVEMVPSTGTPFALSRQDVRITVLAGVHSVDIRGCVAG